MKKYLGLMICAMVALTSACKKDDYKNDGGKSNPYVDMTTYDFLKSKPQFDSLVKIIDHAGLKDVVNSNVTFFATTNYSIAPYVSAKKNQKAIEIGNENFEFGINDIPATELADSMKTYLFEGKINRDVITVSGQVYPTLLTTPPSNVTYMIKFRRTFDYSSFLDHVDYVNYVKIRGTRDDQEPDPEAIPDNQKDQAVDCQTSGIITRTGVVHVIDGNHRLFFNAQSLGN
ncbi:hypothetical protein IM792_03915 [Mucilaginibacter sp. JRF]|uniref:hypothetical protein n=1 Tax=Mucilaginibacter sp. JRF TaxID=2780088 RepID=UPI00187DF945|nr:hypothetical protein [Mucilaginibacter sp. JRF]MBE9583584.1 hypothetical protein [Mucilaginibacter sp. JRF]